MHPGDIAILRALAKGSVEEGKTVIALQALVALEKAGWVSFPRKPVEKKYGWTAKITTAGLAELARIDRERALLRASAVKSI